MRVIAMIQARTGSRRLPGKVLKAIGGEPMLARVVERVRQATLVDQLVVATTDSPADDAIVETCARLAVDVFRGSEPDVLDRYYRAAQAYRAEAVVRVTADCPLIDPAVIDRVVRAFRKQQPDYAANTLERTYPRGLDTEVVAFAALGRAWLNAPPGYQRAHVTPYIIENPDRFRLVSVTGQFDYSEHRWTVDTAEDLEFVRAVYARLAGKTHFGFNDVLAILAGEPELAELNQHVPQKAVAEG